MKQTSLQEFKSELPQTGNNTLTQIECFTDNFETLTHSQISDFLQKILNNKDLNVIELTKALFLLFWTDIKYEEDSKNFDDLGLMRNVSKKSHIFRETSADARTKIFVFKD